MSYIEQRAGRNQRAATISVVAVIQGAAIVALINGLAVKWTEPVPEPVTRATDVPITVTLPPPEPMPSAQPRPDPVPIPAPSSPVDNRPPIPTPIPTVAPDPIPVPTGDFVLPDVFPSQPPPPPLFTPRGAKPRNAPGGWATTDDYPASDLRNGHQGVTRFTLTIGPDGSVLSCAIAASSGFPGLDKATCDKVSQRARFNPATDNSGNRVSGRYTGSVRWQIPRD